MEVIAKQGKMMLYICIAVLIFFLPDFIYLLYFQILHPTADAYVILGFVLFPAIIGLSIYGIVRFSKNTNLIVLEGDTLKFPNGNCNISALTSCTCSIGWRRWWNIKKRWREIFWVNTITLHFRGTTETIPFVKDVESVQQRINQLIIDYQVKQAAEKKEKEESNG